MSRVVVFESVTMDGVMQAPARPDEDVRGGFQHGGWATPYADQDLAGIAAESAAAAGTLLLGRRTYEDFHAVWPNRTDNPYTEVLNNTLKYVASTTLREPLPWQNSKLLEGDAARAMAALRERPGKDVVVLGSGVLVRSLMRHGLVDEFVLLVHPLVLGSGRRLFAEGGPPATLRLAGARTSGSGVVVATYRPADAAPSY
ncbi:MAG TPA: dihydrofolate reductase family protein [Actinomycetes bacterium]|nr:dihydrofolate reductase family protein [Actinomycetes bacterium]